MAQSGERQTKPSLDAAPVPAEKEKTKTILTQEQQAKPTALLPAPSRFSYGLSLGSSFGTGFGATYVEPSVRYQVNDRFKVFGSLTYLNMMPQQYLVNSAEGGGILRHTSGSNHYIANAGVDYLASDRLILSGSVWRDFSNVPAQSRLYNGLFQPLRSGADFRATYKITENISVSGGVRYSNGGAPMGIGPGPYYGGYRW